MIPCHITARFRWGRRLVHTTGVTTTSDGERTSSVSCGHPLHGRWTDFGWLRWSVCVEDVLIRWQYVTVVHNPRREKLSRPHRKKLARFGGFDETAVPSDIKMGMVGHAVITGHFSGTLVTGTTILSIE